MKIRYFDHAATTAVKQEVLREMLAYFEVEYGNPSSLYSVGRTSKRALEQARQKVAFSLNCKPKEIYFTGCGSESDNLAIKGIAMRNKEKGNHIITTKIEHPAVINTCKSLEKEGFEITYLNVNKEGIISLSQLESSIRENTILITIMFANNEIGSIQPIRQIGEIARKKNIVFHTDCVQAIGNEKIDVKQMNIDMLSISAHKFYGPKGVGALYVKEGIEFTKMQDGGHQEKNKRAGTENIAGIVGLGKAIEIASKNIESYNAKLLDLRNYYIKEVTENIKDAKINGGLEKRLSGNANIGFKGVDSEQLLLELDSRGICVSTGSACSSGLSEPSHVLAAIGAEKEYIGGSIRATFGEENTKEDVEYLVKNLIEIIDKIRNT